MPGEFPDEEANGDGVAANVFQPGTPTISVSQNGVPKEVDDVMYSDVCEPKENTCLGMLTVPDRTYNPPQPPEAKCRIRPRTLHGSMEARAAR